MSLDLLRDLYGLEGAAVSLDLVQHSWLTAGCSRMDTMSWFESDS